MFYAKSFENEIKYSEQVEQCQVACHSILAIDWNASTLMIVSVK